MFRVAIIGALCAVVGSAAADVVVNGSFELPVNDANGWTSSVPRGSGFSQSSDAHSGSFAVSTQFIFRDVYTATLSQTLALAAGDVVDVQGFFKGTGWDASSSISISLGGHVIASALVPESGVPDWTSLSASGITITNNNPTLVISFHDLTPDFVFDDISVSRVPAPGTGVLTVGVLAMATRRRR